MTVLSEDNVVQIKMSFLIWIVVALISLFSGVFTWQEIRMSSMGDEIQSLKDKELVEIIQSIDENGDKIYIMSSKDLPEIVTLTSVQQSQLNTLFTVIFGAPSVNNFNKNSPTLPTRNNSN